MEDKDIREIMDGRSIENALTRIAHEIIEHNAGDSGIAVVGIRTRGEYLAHRLVAIIEKLKGHEVAFRAFRYYALQGRFDDR